MFSAQLSTWWHKQLGEHLETRAYAAAHALRKRLRQLTPAPSSTVTPKSASEPEFLSATFGSKNVEFDPLETAFRNTYLLICVDVLVEPLERINIEFHQFSQKVKVTLKHISWFALTINNAVENMLARKENMLLSQFSPRQGSSTV